MIKSKYGRPCHSRYATSTKFVVTCWSSFRLPASKIGATHPGHKFGIKGIHLTSSTGMYAYGRPGARRRRRSKRSYLGVRRLPIVTPTYVTPVAVAAPVTLPSPKVKTGWTKVFWAVVLIAVVFGPLWIQALRML